MKGKHVLVVGGTHGVGEQVAWKCHRAGAEVTVIGLTKNDYLPFKQVIMNVVEEVELVEDHMIGMNYVFNNIGMIGRNNVAYTDKTVVKKFLKVNLETMFMLTQYAARYVSEVVVDMSSRPIFSSYDCWSLYALTKHAIIDLVKAAAEENPQKFYALCPSRIDTKFRDSVFPDEDKSTRLTPEQAARYVFMLFNGLNPSGSYYWLRKIYATGADSRNF